jgi:hypothetical protein
MEISNSQIEDRFGNIDVLFEQADVDEDGYISPDEAKNFFPHFKITRESLRSVNLRIY